MERLLNYFEPEKYVLDLVIDKNKKEIGGVVTVFGTAKAQEIKFHAVSLDINEVTCSGEKLDFEIKDNILTIKKVPSDGVAIEIKYKGNLNHLINKN